MDSNGFPAFCTRQQSLLGIAFLVGGGGGEWQRTEKNKADRLAF